MFAYCNNNPVNCYDPAGKTPEILKELGNRFLRVINFWVDLYMAANDAFTIEVGAGAGVGVSASVVAGGIPMGVNVGHSISDIYVYENGEHDIRSRTNMTQGMNIANVITTQNFGHEHSYFDEACTCDFMRSTFEEKSNCPANVPIPHSNTCVGISFGGYIGLGAEFSIVFDYKKYGNALIDISKKYLK